MLTLDHWTRIHAWTTARLRRAYLDTYYHARLCPNCRRWTSETGGSGPVRYADESAYLATERVVEDASRYEFMTCAGCGHESRWDLCAAMLPVLAEPAETAARHAEQDRRREAEAAQRRAATRAGPRRLPWSTTP